MMRKLGALALGAFILAGPVLAEPPTGSRLGERSFKGLQHTEEQADEASTKIASCMVAKRGAPARAYIDATTTEEADKAQQALFRQIQCISFVNVSDMSDTSVIDVPRDIMRGKLAEALLKEQGKAVAALPVLPLAKEYSRPWFKATTRDPVIDEMAVCVVETNPQGVAKLLATRGYSKDEGTAFGAVVPTLGTCLRVGAKLQANRQALRAALADALYQRLMRPAPVAAPTTAAK